MLIDLLIAILFFLARKITAEHGGHRVFILLRVTLRPPRLNSLFGSGGTIENSSENTLILWWCARVRTPAEQNV
jgi:hypothetical protein